MSTSPPPPPAPEMPPEAYEYLKWLFAFRSLSVKQKLLSIAQKYYVNDEEGRPRFYVVRPPKLMLSIFAGIAGFTISMLGLYFAYRFITSGFEVFHAIAALFVARLLGSLVMVLLRPYRDIGIFTDESERFTVLTITQDNKFGLWHRFSIYDAMGQPVATAKRSLLLSLVRRTWWAETLDGRTILKIQEDSLPLAMLRRYLGPMWGMLRTNFDLLLPNGARIGEYNRKLTLTDQYILNLDGDPWFLVDRRVALALAILLDTGEGR